MFGFSRRGPAGPLLLLLLSSLSFQFSGCARHAGLVSVPPEGVRAVEGTGTGWFRGRAFAVKGRFAFSFDDSGRGRVEAFDPLGRTVLIMISGPDREFLAVPSRRIYAETAPGGFAARFLGLAMTPLEMLGLLSGDAKGRERLAAAGWRLELDGRGRLRSGEKDGRDFEVTGFFGDGGVPREVRSSLEGPGRVTFRAVRFNPRPRPDIFDPAFLERFKPKTVEELEAIIADES